MARSRPSTFAKASAAWVWRRLCHPIMLLVWIAVATWSLKLLVEQRTFADMSPSTTRRVLHELLSGRDTAWRTVTRTYDLYGVSEGAGVWRILDTNVESADELSRLWQTEPERVVQVAVVLEEEARGTVAQTSRQVRDHVTIAPFSSRALAEKDAQAVRRAAVDYLLLDYPELVGERSQSGRIAHVRSTDVDQVATVWSGYGVNVGLAAGTLMSVLSLARAAVLAPGPARRLRARRRVRRGECPSCGYALAGVVGHACPECGASITPPG